ncbi:DUF3471 domain-containing protein, partial [Brevundimonas sp.]|uniref:DUF3471 domain-containing protein n=1 Tax=Brevundimonas sp. TaxID=1871086 RepID=UPI0025C5210F
HERMSAHMHAALDEEKAVVEDEWHSRHAAAVSADALAAYAGVYEIAPAFSLTLQVTDGVLTAQATGQKPVALTPETADAFFVEAIDAQITFTRNAAGEIEGLVLHQGGREMPARRK